MSGDIALQQASENWRSITRSMATTPRLNQCTTLAPSEIFSQLLILDSGWPSSGRAYWHQVHMLVKLSVSTDQVLTNSQMLQWVFSRLQTCCSAPMSNIVKRLSQELEMILTTPPTSSTCRASTIDGSS